MNDKEIIQRLIGKVEAVREAQRNYFKFKGDTWKKQSIALETDLDEYVRQLRRQGYEPRKGDNTKQDKLF